MDKPSSRVSVAFAGVALSALLTAIGGLAVGWVDKLDDTAKRQAVLISQMVDVRERLAACYTTPEAAREHNMIWRTDEHQYKQLETVKKVVARMSWRYRDSAPGQGRPIP